VSVSVRMVPLRMWTCWKPAPTRLQTISSKFRTSSLSIQTIYTFEAFSEGIFWGHFDVLMDYAHRMLCLDDTKVIQAAVKGGHIALVTPSQTPNEVSLTTLLIILVRLSGFGVRQLLLTLDSGANASFLFNHAVYLTPGLRETRQRDGYGGDGVEAERRIRQV
jgi:hypothetical protein